MYEYPQFIEASLLPMSVFVNFHKLPTRLVCTNTTTTKRKASSSSIELQTA